MNPIPIKSKGDETLETMLNLATSPQNTSENWDLINEFCKQVNVELEGPQIAVKLISHKIQSPQEKEALFALTVIDSCVRQCDVRFHREIGKFRFLNEMIKVISPKYLGQSTSELVKRRCIELFYIWHKGLTDEPKISEAYQMLKRQGIVKDDPTYMEHQIFVPPTSSAKSATIFDNNEKSKQLARLLRSRNPEDLQAANRLIKSIVQEDNERIEKISRRMSDLETVKNNTKLLDEMLLHYVPDVTQLADMEIMKELVDTLERTRTNMFQFARETDDKDQDALNEIIRVTDAANDAVKRYRDLVDQTVLSALRAPPPLPYSPSHTSTSTPQTNHLDELRRQYPGSSGGQPPAASAAAELDLLGLDDSGPNYGAAANGCDLLSSDLANLDFYTSPPSISQPSVLPTPATSSQPPPPYTPLSAQPDTDLLSDLFSSPSPLALSQAVSSTPAAIMPSAASPTPTTKPNYSALNNFSVSSLSKPATTTATGLNVNANLSSNTTVSPSTKAFEDLDILGRNFMKQAKGTTTPVASTVQSPLAARPTPTQDKPAPSPVPEPPTTSHDILSSPLRTASPGDLLSSVSLSLASVQPHPHHTPHLLLEDANKIKVMLHFTDNHPLPTAVAMVIVITSTNPAPVNKIVFKVTVSDTFRVHQQASSGDCLPSFSPFLPPSAVNQILLIDNPSKKSLKFKYQLTYEINGVSVSSSGIEDELPAL